MDYSKIGVRYAKALFELADEKNLIDVVVSDMRSLFENLMNGQGLIHYLTNPVIKPVDKLALVDEVFGGKFNPMTVDFLKLVIGHRREEHLPAMCRRVEFLYKEKFGIKSLELISAIDLDKEVLGKIELIVKQALKADKLEVKTRIDEDIIGGFVLDMEDLRYDASLKTQLNKLQLKLK